MCGSFRTGRRWTAGRRRRAAAATARKNRRSGCPAAVVAGAVSRAVSGSVWPGSATKSRKHETRPNIFRVFAFSWRSSRYADVKRAIGGYNAHTVMRGTPQRGDRMMKKTMMPAALAIGVVLGYSGTVLTQTDQKLPVAGYAPAKDIPGARELPSPDVDYKVVFSVAAVAKPEEIHPTLKTIALYLNTLAHNGVPAGHRHIAAVFHQGGGDAVLTNDVYKARHNGTVNPNIALLHELKQAGVDLRVCGQGLLGKKVDPKDMLPDVQVDLWAMTTMVNLQLRGYVRIGG